MKRLLRFVLYMLACIKTCWEFSGVDFTEDEMKVMEDVETWKNDLLRKRSVLS